MLERCSTCIAITNSIANDARLRGADAWYNAGDRSVLLFNAMGALSAVVRI
jgi:hypothetical protein